MQGLFFEDDTTVRYVLRFIVLLLGLWTAWRTGKAVAEGWGGLATVTVYTLLLAVVARFLHYALFQGPFLNGFYYALDFVLLALVAFAGFRVRRARQMVQNYYWLYEPVFPFSWKRKD